MRARLVDHEGPMFVSAFVGLLGAASLFGPLTLDLPFTWFTAPFGLVLLGLAIGKPLPLPPRDVALLVGPGLVRVKNGTASFRIRASDVVAATTSRHEGKIALSLLLGSRAATPVTLLLDDEREAEHLRACLALDRDGTGETFFASDPATTEVLGRRLAHGAALLGTIGLLVSLAGNAMARLTHSPSLWSVVLELVALFGWLGVPLLLASLMRYTRPPPHRLRRLALRGDALHVPTAQGSEAIPYRAIADVAVEGRTIVVTTEERAVHRVPIALPAEHVAIAASHVRAAAERAAAGRAADAALEDRLAYLARDGETVPAWLARLDGLAASMRQPGYRGRAADRDDLVAALADPDLRLDLRVAATRVLARLEPEARTRVAFAAAHAPSEAHAKLFRVAHEDPEEVAAAYEASREEEVRASSRRRLG